MALDETPVWPCLTILYHPDLRRVGEVAIIGQLVGKGTVDISRREPDFCMLGSSEGRPLRDPYLSRRPVRLHLYPETEVIDITPAPGVHLHVNGRRAESTVSFDAAELHDGVVLQLSRRVILLLHTLLLRERPLGWGLVGESDGICQVRRQIAQVADLDVPVLIRGETGVGKERVAQSIHAASRRIPRPCIAVNMAAISPGTAVSELFGHVKGAFTGAVNRSIGLFERADGGTLFLDEIGETPASIQAMLLRTLAEGTIMPVGEQTERRVDVRIIAATDANIEEGAEDGSFRAALLHRLSGYEIRVPPLRERRVDIPRLAVYFLGKELEEIGESWRLEPRGTSKQLWFPCKLMSQLYQHDWPGNVRQLGNVVRQLVISSRGLDELRVDNSVKRTLSENPRRKRRTRRAPTPQERQPSRRAPREVTDDEVYEAMAACNWLVVPAAQRLGIPRSTLYDLINRHPRIRKAKDIPRDELEACLRECDGDLERMVQRLRASKRGIKLRMTQLGIKHEV